MRMLMVAAASLFVFLGTASAQCDSCGTTAQSIAPMLSGGCASCGSAKYGWNPMLRKLAFWNRCDRGGCPSCGWLRGRLGDSCGACGGRFGILSRLNPFRNLGCNSCGTRGGLGGCLNNQIDPRQFYPNGMPGTLVFPYNSYLRSPRDFFMQ